MNFIKKYLQSKSKEIERVKIKKKELINSTNDFYRLTVYDKDNNVMVTSSRKGWFCEALPRMSRTGEEMLIESIFNKEPIKSDADNYYYILNGSDTIEIKKLNE